VLGISATAPTTAPTGTGPGVLPPTGVNHVGLAVGLGTVLAGLGAGLIGWRRRAAPGT
jgi:LPXTG-motif cell wall-anchored protein